MSSAVALGGAHQLAVVLQRALAVEDSFAVHKAERRAADGCQVFAVRNQIGVCAGEGGARGAAARDACAPVGAAVVVLAVVAMLAPMVLAVVTPVSLAVVAVALRRERDLGAVGAERAGHRERRTECECQGHRSKKRQKWSEDAPHTTRIGARRL